MCKKWVVVLILSMIPAVYGLVMLNVMIYQDIADYRSRYELQMKCVAGLIGQGIERRDIKLTNAWCEE